MMLRLHCKQLNSAYRSCVLCSCTMRPFDPICVGLFDRSNGLPAQQTTDIRSFFQVMARTGDTFSKPPAKKECRRSLRARRPSVYLRHPSDRSDAVVDVVDVVAAVAEADLDDEDDDLYEPTPKRQRGSGGKSLRSARAGPKTTGPTAALATPEGPSKRLVVTLESCGLMPYKEFVESLAVPDSLPTRTTSVVVNRILLKLGQILDPGRQSGLLPSELKAVARIKREVAALGTAPENLAKAEAFVEDLWATYEIDCRPPEPVTYSANTLGPRILQGMYQDHIESCEAKRASLMRSLTAAQRSA